MNNSQIDLKVCEGCGALWLRTLAGRVYCRRCAPLLADFPAALGLRPKTRMATRRPVPFARAAQTAGGAR
jgi:hypothetical protein